MIQTQRKILLPLIAASLAVFFLIFFCISFVSANSVAICGNTILSANQDTAYAFTNNNGTWSQKAIFTSTHPTPSSNDVAISHNIAVIGDLWDGDMHQGSVHIFSNNGTTWNQVTTLRSNNPQIGAWFGSHVEISENTLVITGPADVNIFTNTSGTWHQTAHLTADNSTSQTAFGQAVAISGNTIIVGEPLAGVAHIFSNNNGSWNEIARLTAPDQSSYGSFGNAVAISGNIAVIGERWGGDKHQGHAYIFANNGKTWSLITMLSPKDWIGPESYGTANFGSSVAIDGDNVIIGFPSADGVKEGSAINQAGYVYLFAKTNGTWNHVARLTAPVPTIDGFFGESLGIAGNTIVVGGRNDQVTVFTVSSNMSPEISGRDISSQKILQETPPSPTPDFAVTPITQKKASISVFPPFVALGVIFLLLKTSQTHKRKRE